MTNITLESEYMNNSDRVRIKYNIESVNDIKNQIYGIKQFINLQVLGIVINSVTYRNLWLNGHIKKSQTLEEELGNISVYIDDKVPENIINIVI